jgi:hypothetical protein
MNDVEFLRDSVFLGAAVSMERSPMTEPGGFTAPDEGTGLGRVVIR